jgi:hypothetical protein
MKRSAKATQRFAGLVWSVAVVCNRLKTGEQFWKQGRIERKTKLDNMTVRIPLALLDLLGKQSTDGNVTSAVHGPDAQSKLPRR